MLLIGWRKFSCFSLDDVMCMFPNSGPRHSSAESTVFLFTKVNSRQDIGGAHHLLNMNKYQFKFYIFSMDSALHVMEFLEQIYLAAALHYRIWILYTYMDVLGKMNRKGAHKRQNLLSSSSPALSAGVNIYPTLPSCRSERDTLKAINSQGTKTVLGLYSIYIYMRYRLYLKPKLPDWRMAVRCA